MTDSGRHQFLPFKHRVKKPAAIKTLRLPERGYQMSDHLPGRGSFNPVEKSSPPDQIG
jgi:hypothetical protein